jgi:glycosyltransferase involved in cell wall biosynthesis
VRTIERILALVTDHVLVLSARQRDDIGARYRIVPLARIRIMPLRLELDALGTLPLASREHGTVVFGFVGRLVPSKNVPLLIEVFARVHQQLPGTRLLVVGDGELLPEAERLAARHGLEAAIEFAGWLVDLPAVYRSWISSC